MCARAVPDETAIKQASAVAALSASFLKPKPQALEPAAPEVAPASIEFASPLTTDAAPAHSTGPDVDGSCLPMAPEGSSLEVYEPPVIPLGMYLVSVQPRSRFRRLHRMGECAYRPGVDFKSFELLGESEPSPNQFTARCKHCFRTQLAPPSPGKDDSPSASSTDSSTE